MDSITSPKGFEASGLHCGIKKSGKFDLGIISCPEGATAAACFTTNSIAAAPVIVSKEHIKSRKIFGAVVNSGNANACTGKKGLNDARMMCKLTAKKLDCRPEEVLVCSTGIIGEKLPMKNIKEGIINLSDSLSSKKTSGRDLAKAIMTTDTRTKEAERNVEIGKKEVIISGTAKGAGMIGPDMATTLSFITTDAAIGKRMLQKALRSAVDSSFNRLTVDIHQSTNDTSLVLASGMAQNREIKTKGKNYRKFVNALAEVCDDLARQMAIDAEGVSRYFKVTVKGAASQREARKVCRAIADYPLVKCAVHGGDPNWGRIIAAVGSSKVRLDQEKLICKIGSKAVFRNGKPVKFDEKKVIEIISQDFHEIEVDLGIGKSSDFCYGCDLSKEYVTINAEYHT